MSAKTEEALDNKDAIARHLEHLSTGFSQCFNENSFENHWIKGCLSPDFRASYDDAQDLDTDASFDYRRRFKAANPHMVMTILEAASSVDERRGEAKVWQIVELTGQPPGTTRRAFIVIEWEQRGGRWRCCRSTALASMPGIGGDRPLF